MDLNFTKTIEEETSLTVTSGKRDALVKNITNPNTFFFERTTGTLAQWIRVKVDIGSVTNVKSLAFSTNISLLVVGILMILIAFWMLMIQYDLTYLLMDFSRIAKTLHRLKFINVDKTPLVEFFLGSIYNLYQSGLDRPRDEVDKYQG